MNTLKLVVLAHYLHVPQEAKREAMILRRNDNFTAILLLAITNGLKVCSIVALCMSHGAHEEIVHELAHKIEDKQIQTELHLPLQ